jgi:hypothetical protein
MTASSSPKRSGMAWATSMYGRRLWSETPSRAWVLAGLVAAVLSPERLARRAR